jgi:hypothetical protein
MELRQQKMWRHYTSRQRAQFRRAYFLCSEWFAHDNDPERGNRYLQTHTGAAGLGCTYGEVRFGPYGSGLPDLP